MGTRNLTLVYHKNELKVAQYGQWDGYISCAGVKIVKALKKFNMEHLKSQIEKCEFISDESISKLWVEAGADPNSKWVDIEISTKFAEMHPTLYRDLGYNIIEYIADSTDEKIQLKNDIDFAADSLFCEYAYVIDFDKNSFEIYKGFNTTLLSENDRFYYLENKVKEGSNYHPVKLFKQYDLDNLPTVQELELIDTDEDE